MLRTLHDVEICDDQKVLGEGAFSEVVKVRSRADDQFYALKRVS